MVHVRLIRSVSACLVFAAMSVNAAWADNLVEAKKNIQAMYAKKNQAQEKKDVQGMLSIYAPDATVTYPGGKVVKKGELAKQLTAMLPTVKSVVGHDEVTNISLKGNTAFVDTAKSSITVSEDGETHKTDKIVHSAKSKDTWVKIGNNWLLKSVQILSATSTVNGQPMRSQ